MNVSTAMNRLKLTTCVFFLFIFLAVPAMGGNNSGAAFSTWPDTGQTKCYNNSVEIPCPAQGEAFHNQDAQYTGPARSYTLLSGGIMVQDNVTGLIWEMKNSMNGVKNYGNPNDADNTYTWCDTNAATNGGSAGTCGTNDTEDFISQLNSGSGFGGYTNWRMPTIKELKTLIDLGRFNKAIDPIFTSTSDNYYWSSITNAQLYEYAWRVEPNNGYADIAGPKTQGYSVRAVRGEQNPPETRFVDNNDGTITDTASCLQWQKAMMNETVNGVYIDIYNWQDALAASEKLSLAGHSDWRLPNKNELLSLVDYSRYVPAIEPVFVDTSFSSGFWSSTTYAYRPDYAWFSYFGDGYDFFGFKESIFRVRAVRGGGAFGDINKDCFVNLSDAILALQVIAGIIPVDTTAADSDVNGDGKVGLAEAINGLRNAAGSSD